MPLFARQYLSHRLGAKFQRTANFSRPGAPTFGARSDYPPRGPAPYCSPRAVAAGSGALRHVGPPIAVLIGPSI